MKANDLNPYKMAQFQYITTNKKQAPYSEMSS